MLYTLYIHAHGVYNVTVITSTTNAKAAAVLSAASLKLLAAALLGEPLGFR